MADLPRGWRGRSPRGALQDRLSQECLLLRGSVDALLERHLERVASIALPAGPAREADGRMRHAGGPGVDPGPAAAGGVSEAPGSGSEGSLSARRCPFDGGARGAAGRAEGCERRAPAGCERQAPAESAPGSMAKQSSNGSHGSMVSLGRGSHASLGSTARSRTSRGLEVLVDDILSLAELDEADEASRQPRQSKATLSRKDSTLSTSWGLGAWAMEDGAERSTALRAYHAFLWLCCGQRGLAGLQPILGRVFMCIDWVYSLSEPDRSGCLHTFVLSREWTTICALVITLNAVFAIFSTDYDARHYLEPSGFLGETTVAMAAANVTFTAFYAVEIALKLRLHRLYFFCNHEWRWNVFDLMLVLFNVVDLILAALISAADSGPTDLAFMRSLRILKLAKVLRIIRMFRIVSELRLIMNSVIGSVVSLVWSFLVIVFILYLFGILFVQGITAHFYELQVPFSDEASQMFGSVLAGMLTLYMSANGGYDWNEVYDLLASTGWKNAVLFLVYIFVESAMKLAKPDHKVLAQEKHKQELVESGELRRVCENIDVDGDRMITSEEFVAAYQTNKKLRAHFAVLGLDISDAKVFFDTLAGDDDAPEIDIEVFIKHCMRLKGAATSIDLHHFQVENRLACRRQQEFIERCGGRIERLAARVAHLAAVLHRREQGSSARDFEHGHQHHQPPPRGAPASPRARRARRPAGAPSPAARRGAALPAAAPPGRTACQALPARAGGRRPGSGGAGLARLAAICGGAAPAQGPCCPPAERGRP